MGANGFMGSRITRLLVAQGRRVRAMVRPTGDLSALQGLDVEICHGDISDIASLKVAMRGCSSVFYNVVDTRAWLVDSAPLYRTNVDGLTNVIDAAVAENIARFVFTSSMVTLPRHSGSPVQENHPYTEMCMPGDNTEMHVELINPIAMDEGLRFAIREGGRTVGAGSVTKILK